MKLGGYTISQKDKKLSDSCEDFSINDMVYTDSEFEAGGKEMSTRQDWAREDIEKYIDDNDNKHLITVGAKALFYYFFIVITLPLSVICFVLLFIYFFFRACIGCCCAIFGSSDDENETEDKKKKRQIFQNIVRVIIIILSFAMVIATIAFGYLWGVSMLKSIKNLKKTECSSSYVAGDLRVGVQYKENS